MMAPDVCRYCYKKIKNRDELVTASRWGAIKPFHYLCYENIQKETRVTWLSWKPLNGLEGNVVIILLTVLAIWLFVTNTGGRAGNLVAVIALYPLFLRMISYVVFERKIRNLSSRSGGN